MRDTFPRLLGAFFLIRAGAALPVEIDLVMGAVASSATSGPSLEVLEVSMSRTILVILLLEGVPMKR